MKYTKEMEIRRVELQKEFEQLESLRDDAIAQLDNVLNDVVGQQPPRPPGSVNQRAERFIRYAEDLRDALAPFDSGVRKDEEKAEHPAVRATYELP